MARRSSWIPLGRRRSGSIESSEASWISPGRRRRTPGPKPAWPVVERVRDSEAQGRLEGVDCRWEVKGVCSSGSHRRSASGAGAGQPSPERSGCHRRAEGNGDHRDPPGGTRSRGPFSSEARGDPPGVNYAHRRRVAAAAESDGLPAPLTAAERVVVLTVEDNGPGNGSRDSGRDFRSVLHDEGAGEGDWAWVWPSRLS